MRLPEIVLPALLIAFLAPAAAGAAPYTLRYQLLPGQTWYAVQTVVRETRIAGTTETHTGSARFRYEVGPGARPGEVRLDARMLSQETDEGKSPFDFSVIHFLAQTDPRGVIRGMHYQLGDATPPELPDLPPDPVAYRQMLRSVGAAWIEAVYWLPELPEAPLAVGESFIQSAGGDVGGTDPGVSMKQRQKTTYTLRRVSGSLAEFGIEVRSIVDASTARNGIISTQTAEGEATFDLDAGMWSRWELRSEHRASLRGTDGGDDQASARTVTTLSMRLGEAPPAAQPSLGRPL